MARFIDETGNLYGLLKVLRRGSDNSRGAAMWVCQCACGLETTVHGGNLRSGRTRSCGPCGTFRTHGRSRAQGRPSPEYVAWLNMHRRGAVAWDSFAQFFEDMGERPSSWHRLRRRDRNAPWGKGNCGWVR